MWSSQSWYPILTTLLLLPPVTLPPSKNLPSLLEYLEISHPLHKMSLLICLLSGNNSKALASPHQQRLSLHHGQKVKPPSTRPISRNGQHFADNNTVTSYHHQYPWPWIFCPCYMKQVLDTALQILLLACCRLSYSSTPIYPFRLDSYQLSSAS